MHFRHFQSESSDEDVMTATASSEAAAGSTTLDVTRLAQNHKMGSDAFLEASGHTVVVVPVMR